MDRDSGREPMLDMFIFESLQLSDQLEQLVLNSEKSNSFKAAEINEIFRIMHTIKGSAAMMEFNNISAVAHSMEDLFYQLRESDDTDMNYSILCDLVLNGIDFVKREIAKIESDQEADGIPDALLDDIHGYLASLNPSQAISLEELGNAAIDENHQADTSKSKFPKIINMEEKRFQAIVFFDEGCEMENIRAFNVLHKITEMAQVIQSFPPDIDDYACVDSIRQEGFKVDFTTDFSKDEMEEFFLKIAFVESIEIVEMEVETEEFRVGEPNGTDRLLAQAEKEVDTNFNTSTKQNIISVQLKKLDQLLDLVGELVISETILTCNPDLAAIQDLDSFNKAARQHRKLIIELQDIVMSIRMVPLAGTFQKMNRIVRDMSKNLGKQVELEIRGEETEVDKNIIEHLSDPLMHIIRNSVDHGIEIVADRIAAGKPAKGKIQLEAKNEGGDVWITVRDDGGGLNKEKILSRALEHGLISKVESELTDQEIYQFILLPGFSTNTEVTEYSGRGVGMDVVAQNIEEIGGSVHVDSKMNMGTTISLRIPLTLAIIEGMGIRVGSSIYTVPMTAIRESFKAKENEIFTDPDGLEMIMVRGECLPILRLHELYTIQSAVNEIHDGIIMIAETDNRSVCLFADELLGEQQVVVKALPRYLKKIRGIGGCTLLGDGRSSLILDIAGLVNH